jgi:hypothetical protein
MELKNPSPLKLAAVKFPDASRVKELLVTEELTNRGVGNE